MNVDFSLVFVGLTLLTGGIWALDAWVFAPRRRERAVAEGTPAEEAKVPVVAEYAKAFFPIILFVLVFRSFLFEPFRIPSGSMKPTLEIGDFILVNKFAYGLRLPVLNTRVVDIGEPKRGDVMVFRLPGNAGTHYIKRVIGLPGDEIRYEDKTIYVNGEMMPIEVRGPYTGHTESGRPHSLAVEMLGDTEHEILLGRRRVRNDSWVVPNDHYFMMGDNRDNSRDSRFIGAIPEDRIVGKAILIWLTWPPDLQRMGDKIR